MVFQWRFPRTAGRRAAARVALLLAGWWSAGPGWAQTPTSLLFAVSEGTSGGGAAVTDEQMETKYKVLTEAMKRALGQPIRVKYMRDFRMLAAGMASGEFDLVLARPSDYPARGVRDQGYTAVTATQPDGHCLLVVPKDSPYQTIADVKSVQHQRLILPERIAYMTTFCTAELRDRGLPVDPAKTHYVREQAAIPFALNHKLAQIGGIASYSGAAKRLDKDGLRVLHKSRPQPYLPLIAGKRFSPDQIARLRDEVVGLAQTEQGAKDLAALGIARFDPNPQPRLLALLDWLESKTPVPDGR